MRQPRTRTGRLLCIWPRKMDMWKSRGSLSSTAQIQQPRPRMGGLLCIWHRKMDMWKSCSSLSSTAEIQLPRARTGDITSATYSNSPYGPAATAQDSRAWFPLERASRGGASVLPALATSTSTFSIAPAWVKSVPYFQLVYPFKHSSCTFPLTYICARLCSLLRDHHCPIHSTSLFPLCHNINTSTTPLSHPLYL